jgi:hypothetical protein
MFMFIFSTAFTIVLIGIVFFCFWVLLATGLIVYGVIAFEETHNAVWLLLSLLGFSVMSAGVR